LTIPKSFLKQYWLTAACLSNTVIFVIRGRVGDWERRVLK
jgi:hypothetical protein